MLVNEVLGPFNHGFHYDDWANAKLAAHEFLKLKAANRQLTTYGAVANHVSHIIELRGPNGRGILTNKMARFCGELSVESDHQGRGMITAIVGNKANIMPGQGQHDGFFDLAQMLGRPVNMNNESSCKICWATELVRVFSIHSH